MKTLVEDPDARIQWVFANRNVEALLVQWAHARGETGDTIVRAMDVMLEPHPGGPHDDHVHVRTACAPDEVVAGCEYTGPRRTWIDALDKAVSPASDWELAEALFRPFASRTDRTASTKTTFPDAESRPAR